MPARSLASGGYGRAALLPSNSKPSPNQVVKTPGAVAHAGDARPKIPCPSFSPSASARSLAASTAPSRSRAGQPVPGARARRTYRRRRCRRVRVQKSQHQWLRGARRRCHVGVGDEALPALSVGLCWELATTRVARWRQATSAAAPLRTAAANRAIPPTHPPHSVPPRGAAQWRGGARRRLPRCWHSWRRRASVKVGCGGSRARARVPSWIARIGRIGRAAGGAAVLSPPFAHPRLFAHSETRFESAGTNASCGTCIKLLSSSLPQPEPPNVSI
eukprot:365684-Chlamydomonas_euryale.AAC.15